MRAFLAGTLLVLAFAAAGCGGGSSPSGSTNTSGNGEASKPAQQVVIDAVNAAKAASSFHMSGQIAAGLQIGVDLTIEKGKGAKGSLTVFGHKVDAVVIGNDAYLKADPALWTQVGLAGAPRGKWLKFPTTDPRIRNFIGIANSTSLFDQLASTHGTITNKGATTYKGQSVVEIFDSTKNATLYVAFTGTAYPVALVKAGAAGSTLAFDNWNMSVTVTAPSGAVDISKLGG